MSLNTEKHILLDRTADELKSLAEERADKALGDGQTKWYKQRVARLILEAWTEGQAGVHKVLQPILEKLLNKNNQGKDDESTE